MKAEKTNRYLDDLKNMNWLNNVSYLFHFSCSIVIELWYGARTLTLPITESFLIGSLLGILMLFQIDFYLFEKVDFESFYPTSSPYREVYAAFVLFSPFIVWGIFRACLKLKLLRRLTNAFGTSDLKNSLGKFPSFIFDKPIDAHCRILRVKSENLPKSKFIFAKEHLEAALQVYIDEVREDRPSGTLDIIYAHEPMPSLVKLDPTPISLDQLIVGVTRSGEIRVDLEDVPHLLVAGQTGGGKSTLLRQWITSLYMSNQNYKFTLIDLKGGLEFQLFENLQRVSVFDDHRRAASMLKDLEEELEGRLSILRANKCKDLVAFRRIPTGKRKAVKDAVKPDFDRHVIVIDEAAEMFLTSGHSSSQDAQIARHAVSKISRLGRACGIHLIIGTQRPDARALDTQVKANLVGKICFPMVDTTSSIIVLNNVRARDLPLIPGRAIWQMGIRQCELQVPYLSIEEAESWLKKSKSNSNSESSTGDAQAPSQSGEVQLA